MLPQPIKIGPDGRCTCDGSFTCPLGRVGMELRCTETELRSRGFRVVNVDESPPPDSKGEDNPF
jgi:hypothetical protein